MKENWLRHLDERLGHLAVDMRIITRAQADEIRARVIAADADGPATSGFGREALALGYLSPDDLRTLETEESRRRRLISGFEIIELVGSGTIATVYHAVQIAMDRHVALKVLHPSLAADPVFVKTYIAEAQAVSRFHHPNIVQGFKAGESNGFFYFAHEYLSGGSLADRLRGGNPENFPEIQLLAYLRQATAALRHAWSVAVYHGDINPGNLFVDAEGNVKLANLGVPRVAEAGGGRGAAGFVRAGPEYAAPEQLARPDLVDAGTDIYNLGATFYHISFGRQPFVAPEGQSLAECRLVNSVPSFALESQERYSGKYLRLIRDMLDPDPGKRPANPEELADRLERFHSSTVGDSPGEGRPAPQIAAPAGTLRRLAVSVASPSAHGNERNFSLARRADLKATLPGIRWLHWGALAVLAAAAVGFVLFG